MNPFHQRIRASLANAALQAALDANAQRRVQGRLAAFASLPDWRQRRQRARAVRAEVMADLDRYLARFVARVEANGMVVHRARDAQEAVRTVLELARAHRARLVAKSKSMLSEEIELNRALEAAGLRVVETDLGEYIVQLRGEKPSHILTPAVHLRRQEVGQLFHEKLGIPYTEEVPVLTRAARDALRTVFLEADIGLSGVNFGVAETGTLCIITNEGNGRMVTSLPPLHIALMGIERLVPTLDDLALMLSLLPRSATGQKMSVYAQLIHSPRRPGELDGATARHLILVDNGRERVRHSPLREALYCIRCGACLNACPVFRELGGHAYVGRDGEIAPYPGPIGAVLSPALFGENFIALAQASSLCGACKDACPVDIDLPQLLTRVRAGDLPLEPEASRASRPDGGAGLSLSSQLLLKAYSQIACRPRLFVLAQKTAALIGGLISPRRPYFPLPAFTGWGCSRDFPRFAIRPFRERFRRGAAQSLPTEKNPEARPSAQPDAPPLDWPDLFARELEALGGRVYFVKRSDLTARLIAFLRERGLGTVWMGGPLPALDEALLTEAGLRSVRDAAASLQVGLSGALAAIAESGTLLLIAEAGSALNASLLPEVHVAVIASSQIVPSLEAALRLREVREASAAVLISGPSRTADIEMSLTIGVHGPKEVHVFVIDERRGG